MIGHVQSPLGRFLSDTVKDKRGVSTVELALICAFLILLVLGATDVTDAVSARRKATIVANTASDLIAQVKSIDAAYAQDVFEAGSAIIAPYEASGLSVTLSSVVIDSTGQAKTAWSLASNATARTRNSDFPLPDDLKSQPSIIVAEVSYRYTPRIGHALMGPITFSETTYAKPREMSVEKGIPCTAVACTQ
jgi:Flp pilus assembly protein TadG